jgi:hypothetical protein
MRPNITSPSSSMEPRHRPDSWGSLRVLSLETMGTIRLPAVKKAGHKTTAGMEYSQISAWPLAFERKSGFEICLTNEVPCDDGHTGSC